MNETNETKVSTWLKETVESHSIYDSQKLGENFKAETGKEPCWPEHSTAQTRAAIQGRGLGGTLKQEELANAYGWEIGEALARKFAEWKGTFQQGRGSRFRAAIKALEQAGL